MRDLWPGLLRDGRLVAIAVGRASLAFLRFRFGHAEDDFMDRAVAGTDRESDLVALFRLSPYRLSLWRQLLATVFIDVEKDAVLRHVGVEPCTLSGHEGLAVDGEAIVLVPFREQVLLPGDAEGGALVFAEFSVSGEEAGLVERLGEPPPEDALALLRFELLPDGGLILARGGGDRAKLLFSWHVARADLIEDGGMDSREKTELTDLAHGNGERGRDRLFGPVLRGEAFDGAPEVDRGHRSADDVFAHRPHLVVVVRVFDQDVDLGKADLYGDSDPPRAVGDGELVVLFGGGGRLQDTDGFDAGGERRVRQFAGLDFARVVGVRLEDSGIDASQFHLNSPGLRSSRTSSKMKPGERGRSAGAKAARSAGIRTPSEAAERTRPLRRLGVPCLRCRFFSVPAFEAPFL